ncbi:E3 ubiquitin-protein ligase RNFT1-like [Abrus precatorius]|uniref:E3 ubiquitin-protein ligase RNFT1-like n=1 Tax=Abrus precatorius TaxID=3816 RepID=A0A8B8JKL8_ABRPR|nr:E3 ubiquitin-protein ligase RNFT1-like [Abrus precatorius]
MESLGANSDQYATVSSNSSSSSSSSSGGVSSSDDSNGNSNGSLTWYGMRFPSVSPFRSPLSFLLDYSGILRSPDDSDAVIVNNGVSGSELRSQLQTQPVDAAASGNSAGEVAIRIIGTGEHDQNEPSGSSQVGYDDCDVVMGDREGLPALDDDGAEGHGGSERVPLVSSSSASSLAGSGQVDGDATGNGIESESRDSSSYQRFDIHQIAKWIEQILPFSLLLLVVFIRQHLQGFFVTIWISAVMFKSNEIVKKQTALKGDRKVSILVGISSAFMLHVMCIYWWYRKDDLLYPLVMFPPRETPFWHAIFIILVNDTLVRQAAMAVKCVLLIYYKNGKGHNFRRQAQMLTLVEYTLLLYRALLPTPVWYRFFLNRDYGSLFSSLTTGLYLTFKLTSVLEKFQCFISALKALSSKEVHYGVYATMEQVNAAGDLCAICQEKMQAPILLRCKHIFCEDCVLEWFERERTCPLCRALVKPADLRTFGDGSTSLLFQLF